jgi:precorrin-6A synthase
MSIYVVGVGMGPQHVTPEAAEALGRAAYVVAADKGADDPLLAVRREVCRLHGDLPLVAVTDPERDRDDPADYDGAVRDWHAARAAAYADEIASREGDPAFLVWGDPSLYDSTIRVAGAVADRLGVELVVVAGISAPQLLAARHRIVLHAIGQPVHVTTARRLREAIDSGQRNVLVMLSAGLDLAGLDDWSIWWGANLGTASERLVSGRVGDVLVELQRARTEVKAEAGWVMDVYLLRADRP